MTILGLFVPAFIIPVIWGVSYANIVEGNQYAAPLLACGFTLYMLRGTLTVLELLGYPKRVTLDHQISFREWACNVEFQKYYVSGGHKWAILDQSWSDEFTAPIVTLTLVRPKTFKEIMTFNG